MRGLHSCMCQKKRKKIQNKKNKKLHTNFISGKIADKSGQITWVHWIIKGENFCGLGQRDTLDGLALGLKTNNGLTNFLQGFTPSMTHLTIHQTWQWEKFSFKR